MASSSELGDSFARTSGLVEQAVRYLDVMALGVKSWVYTLHTRQVGRMREPQGPLWDTVIQ